MRTNHPTGPLADRLPAPFHRVNGAGSARNALPAPISGLCRLCRCPGLPAQVGALVLAVALALRGAVDGGGRLREHERRVGGCV